MPGFYALSTYFFDRFTQTHLRKSENIATICVDRGYHSQ